MSLFDIDLKSSSTRSVSAKAAPVPSVDITDTTPTHSAATLRADRHHTHQQQVAIMKRLPEAYSPWIFLLDLLLPWAAYESKLVLGARSTCVSVRRVYRMCMAVPTGRGDSAKAIQKLCAARRHQRVKVVESSARARDV